MRKLVLERHHRNSKSFSILEVQISGFHPQNVPPSPVSFMPSMMPLRRPRTRRTALRLRFVMAVEVCPDSSVLKLWTLRAWKSRINFSQRQQKNLVSHLPLVDSTVSSDWDMILFPSIISLLLSMNSSTKRYPIFVEIWLTWGIVD